MPDSWLGRRIAFLLRHFALKRLDAPVDVESFGARFRLYPFDNVCEKRILFTPQYFDADERRLIAGHIQASGAPYVFVDIGANIGGYSLFVANAARGGAKVFAIEPQPEIFDRLIENIRQNPGSGVKAVACAIADQDGEAILFVDNHNRGETGLKFVRPDQQSDGVVVVPAKTLLAFAQEEGLSQIDALKIDVEGAEDIILAPFFQEAPESLWPRMLIVESARERWQLDLMRLLHEKGYRVLTETRLNFVLERSIETAS
ncbi:methyltransferase [Agaricicola taiwanensis]|uniref:Methyltransferase n=2 Tax=Agaricicola taiwanensis TaxID=591372 RepID=A0A8J2YE97_9RHOB|nr:methyltransferase [Agaricicola taiwanensis]